MGKRSNFDRKPRDFYETIDPKALPESFKDLIRGRKYYEPCCGGGKLADQLKDVATLVGASDIEPQGFGVKKDAFDLKPEDLVGVDCLITNPVFDRKVLLPMIDHFVGLKPTWLLLPADYMHNAYFGPYMEKCTRVVSIGRICWFPTDEGKRVASTENFCWYFWPKNATKDCVTEFKGRV